MLQNMLQNMLQDSTLQGAIGNRKHQVPEIIWLGLNSQYAAPWKLAAPNANGGGGAA